MSSGRDVIITGTCYLCLLILIPQGRKINTLLVFILIQYILKWNNFLGINSKHSWNFKTYQT